MSKTWGAMSGKERAEGAVGCGCLAIVAAIGLALWAGWDGENTATLSKAPDAVATVEDQQKVAEPPRDFDGITKLGKMVCRPLDRAFCPEIQAQFDRSWTAAFAGKLWAQRSVAANMKPAPPRHLVGTSAVQSCAWRLLVLERGGRQLKLTDTTDAQQICGTLSRAEAQQAAAVAMLILGRIEDGMGPPG